MLIAVVRLLNIEDILLSVCDRIYRRYLELYALCGSSYYCQWNGNMDIFVYGITCTTNVRWYVCVNMSSQPEVSCSACFLYRLWVAFGPSFLWVKLAQMDYIQP